MEHAISSTGIPSGEQHPPWQDGERRYGPDTPGAYDRSLKTHAEGRAGGGLWDHEVGGGGEVVVVEHLYAPVGERKRVSTISKESARFVAKVRQRLDVSMLSPSELRVWGDLEQGHSVEWIARHRGLRRESVERIKVKLAAGGM